MSFKFFLNVLTHCDYVLIFNPCVLLAYDLCPQHFLSVGQLLSDCTSPQQCSVNDKSTLPNMQSTHTHVLLFGIKFHIILAMYVRMLDILVYIQKIKKHRKNRIFSKNLHCWKMSSAAVQCMVQRQIEHKGSPFN